MGDVAQGPWVRAFYSYIDKPKYTNREASGLISFARAVVARYGKQPNVALTDWDWYAYALPALGWQRSGDKFKVDTKWQLQPYVANRQLRDALLTMAAELDEASVPFAAPVDPRGTDAGFRQLAVDAWTVMQNLRAQGLDEAGQPPPELARAWEGVTLPGSPIATSALDAAAAAGKKKPKKQQEQLDLPGVPPATIQPVGEPVRADTPTRKGGGAGWLLLLLALGSKRRKRSGRR